MFSLPGIFKIIFIKNDYLYHKYKINTDWAIYPENVAYLRNIQANIWHR